MISYSHASLLLSACFLCVSNIASFTPQITRRHGHEAPHHDAITPFPHSQTALSMAGFGAASSKKKKGGAKVPKLKAKAQWDRYQDMKQREKINVGVRIKGDDDESSANEWMEVGRVRSADDDNAEVAVAMQRALIAEHSKRIYPVQIPANAVLEWGYMSGEEWVVVDKSKGDDAPKGVEKKIGFEGISDKATGFYCYYHEGRIVEKEEEGMGTRGAGFAAIKGK
ncbi:hypothetical protein ACHAXR_006866 [Thalassiosira sp. AJA248-18]